MVKDTDNTDSCDDDDEEDDDIVEISIASNEQRNDSLVVVSHDRDNKAGTVQKGTRAGKIVVYKNNKDRGTTGNNHIIM